MTAARRVTRLVRDYSSIIVDSGGYRTARERDPVILMHLEAGRFAPDDFRFLILPMALKVRTERNPCTWMASAVVLRALEHPDCPVDVLSRVVRNEDGCRQWVPPCRYRDAALRNPNCPEEDQVFAALSPYMV